MTANEKRNQSLNRNILLLAQKLTSRDSGMAPKTTGMSPARAFVNQSGI